MKVRIQKDIAGIWTDIDTGEASERSPRLVTVTLAAREHGSALESLPTYWVRSGVNRDTNRLRIHPDDLAAVRDLPKTRKAPKPDALAEARAAGARDERAAIRKEAMNRARAHADRGETGAAGALVLLASWIDGSST